MKQTVYKASPCIVDLLTWRSDIKVIITGFHLPLFELLFYLRHTVNRRALRGHQKTVDSCSQISTNFVFYYIGCFEKEMKLLNSTSHQGFGTEN